MTVKSVATTAMTFSEETPSFRVRAAPFVAALRHSKAAKAAAIVFASAFVMGSEAAVVRFGKPGMIRGIAKGSFAGACLSGAAVILAGELKEEDKKKFRIPRA